MTEIIFDRKLLQQNRKRALNNFDEHSFLHHEIANRIAENVEYLNREFNSVLEIGAMDDYLLKKVVSCSLLVDGKKTSNSITNNEPKTIPDSEVLNLQPESFDLILSNLNFHFINQIPQFLVQVKEALKPGGVFIASFFGEENLAELAHSIHEAEMDIYGGVSPRMAPTIDVKTAANLLQKAGFENPISDFDKIEVDYSNPKNLLKDLKMMGQGNILTKRSRKFCTKTLLNKILENYQKLYASKDGVKATFEIVTVTGWKEKND